MSIAGKLTTIADKIQKVFDAGKKSAYDEFWDGLQKNGKQSIYTASFGGAWTDSIFKPKYDLKVSYCGYMFYDTRINDVKGCLEKAGVILDTSKCKNFNYFMTGQGSICPKIIATAPGANLSYMFGWNTFLEYVEELEVSETATFTSSFANTKLLHHMVISGTIGQKGFDVKDSPNLDKESITSIINALSDTTNGLTVTLSKTAVNNAFGIDIDDESTYPEGSEFYTLRNSKKNWTISYV